MKKKTPYLDFYYKCMETGQLPYREAYRNSGGLCSIFGNRVNFKLFMPRMDEELQYTVLYGYWGTDDIPVMESRVLAFTPLRQTIVLFLAAMNGEL